MDENFQVRNRPNRVKEMEEVPENISCNQQRGRIWHVERQATQPGSFLQHLCTQVPVHGWHRDTLVTSMTQRDKVSVLRKLMFRLEKDVQ